MKFTTSLIANIKSYFAKAIGAMLIMGMIWQGSILGIDSAFAAGRLNGNCHNSFISQLQHIQTSQQ